MGIASFSLPGAVQSIRNVVSKRLLVKTPSIVILNPEISGLISPEVSGSDDLIQDLEKATPLNITVVKSMKK
jgi:hypothetical protein